MPLRIVLLVIGVAGATLAQSPSAVTMKQLMLDLIHPASNDILLAINRGGPQTDAEWAVVRRGAVTLAESGDVLLARGPRNQDEWAKDVKLLSGAGAAAYKAAQAKDAKGLAEVADRIDRACTACHQQFRPNVFPHPPGKGGSR